MISRSARRTPLSTRSALRNSLGRGVAASLLVAALGPIGCATAPPADPNDHESLRRANDPFEPLNRVVFVANIEADRYILKPVAYVYKEAVPDQIQIIVSNFLHNLRSPVVLANALLQGDFDHAGNTLLRFTFNSTFGFAGAADIAHDFGFARRNEDFGQTLAVWGAGEGPYLMLPVLGPSNARDAVGRVVDYFTDPFAYFRYERFTYSRFAAKTVDTRVRNYDLLHDLENTSVDYYAAIRSLYRQNRRDAIDNGAEAELPPLPEMAADEDDLEDEEDVLLPTPRAR